MFQRLRRKLEKRSLLHGAMHDNTMDILLTNDDGIAGGGLQKLAELLRTNGKHKVTVIAPEVNRLSG